MALGLALAPAVLVSAIGALWVGVLPLGRWLVAPSAVHLGGCVADLWAEVLIYRQPRGTLMEDLETGVHTGEPACTA